MPDRTEIGRVESGVIAVGCLLIMTAGATWPFAVAVLSPIVREELSFSASSLGIAYSVYYLSASLSSRIVGRFTDARGFRRSGWVLLILSVLQVLLVASARNWWQLAASGAVGGICLIMTNPVTNSLIATFLRGQVAKTVIGFKQAGVPLAAAFAGAVLPGIAAVVGWRMSVLVILVIPLGAGLLLGLMPRDDSPRPTAGGVPTGPIRRLGLEGFVFFMGMIAAGLSGYLALFVVDSLDGSVQRAGTLVATFAASGILGRILWASVGGGRRTLPILRLLGTVGCIALATLALPLSEWTVWLAVVGAGLSVMAWQGLGMLTVVEFDTGGTIGAASSHIMRRFYFGFVLGAPLTGTVIDTVGFRPAWAVLCAAAFSAIVALRPPGPAPAPIMTDSERAA